MKMLRTSDKIQSNGPKECSDCYVNHSIRETENQIHAKNTNPSIECALVERRTLYCTIENDQIELILYANTFHSVLKK